MIEIWKKVEGFNRYEVSNLGRVRSLDWWTYTIGKGFLKPGRVLKLKNSRYLQVHLYEGKVSKYFLVHRLVAETFLGRSEDLQVNHIDGNRHNNKLINLEWVTASRNVRHAYETGLTTPSKGEAHYRVKLKKRRYREIAMWRSKGYTFKTIAATYGVAPSYIFNICKRFT